MCGILSSCVGVCSLRMIRRPLGQAVCPTRPRAHLLWRRRSLCRTAPQMCPPRPVRHPARPPACSNGASRGGVIGMARGRGGVPWAVCSRSMLRSLRLVLPLRSAAPPAVAGCREAFLARCRGLWDMCRLVFSSTIMHGQSAVRGCGLVKAVGLVSAQG